MEENNLNNQNSETVQQVDPIQNINQANVVQNQVVDNNVNVGVSNTTPKKPNNQKLFVIIGIILVVVILGFVLFGSKSKDNNDNIEEENKNEEVENNDEVVNSEEEKYPSNVEEVGTSREFVLITIANETDDRVELNSVLSKLYSEQQTVDELKNLPESDYNGFKYRLSKFEYDSGNRKFIHYTAPSFRDFIFSVVSGFVQPNGAVLSLEMNYGAVYQTIECLRILNQLGVSKVIVYINDYYSERDDVAADATEVKIRNALDKYGFDGDNTPIIRGNIYGALDGEAAEEENIRTLVSEMENWFKPTLSVSEENLEIRIDDVSNDSDMVVATGKVISGDLILNEEVEIVGGSTIKKATIIGIEKSDIIVDYAQTGDNVSVMLRGINKEDVTKGFTIVSPGTMKTHKNYKANIILLSKEEGGRQKPFFNDYEAQFSFGSIDVNGSVTIADDTITMLMPGDHAQLNIALNSSVAMKKGTYFLIKEEGKVIGIGVVIDALD